MKTFDLTLGGKTFKAATANIATLKAHKPFLVRSAQIRDGQAEASADDIAAIFEMTEILHECIVRVDSSVTLQQIEEAGDQQDIMDAFAKVMGNSGFQATDSAGEPKPAG